MVSPSSPLSHPCPYRRYGSLSDDVKLTIMYLSWLHTLLTSVPLVPAGCSAACQNTLLIYPPCVYHGLTLFTCPAPLFPKVVQQADI